MCLQATLDKPASSPRDYSLGARPLPQSCTTLCPRALSCPLMRVAPPSRPFRFRLHRLTEARPQSLSLSDRSSWTGPCRQDFNPWNRCTSSNQLEPLFTPPAHPKARLPNFKWLPQLPLSRCFTKCRSRRNFNPAVQSENIPDLVPMFLSELIDIGFGGTAHLQRGCEDLA